MTVLVVGASGAVGGAVVARLVQHGVEVRATSRDPKRLAMPDGVEVFTADLNEPASFTEALDGVERVFLYADIDDPGPLVATVAAADVRQVVLLSSASTTFPGAAEDFNASRFLRVEAAILGSGLPYTFLRPGSFASNASRWSWSIRHDGAVPLPYPDAVQVPVHESDIADVAVLALTGDALLGARPVLTGPERLTLREQIDTIGALTARALTIVRQTEAESAQLLSQHLSPAWVNQTIKTWRTSVNTVPAISEDYHRITGSAPRTFRTWVHDHIDLFR